MVDNVFPVDAVTGAPSYTGRKLRQTGSPLIMGATGARPLGSRTGVRPGTSATTVTATSTTWTCLPFAGVADAETAAEAGPYQFAFDANATGAVTAANATNPRVDIIWVRIDDPAEADGTSVPIAVRGYTAGTAAASPVAPAPPARAFVIANINVPVSGGGSPTVTWVAPYVVAAGGILPVSGVAGYPANPYVGQAVDDPNLGIVRYTSAGWRAASGVIIPTSAPGNTIGADGWTSFTASSLVDIRGLFDATASVYELQIDLTAASAADDLAIQLTTGGTAYTPATQISILGDVTKTNTIAGATNLTRNALVIGRVGTAGMFARLDLHAPFLTRGKFVIGQAFDADDVHRLVASRNADTASRDGLILRRLSGTGTLTGRMKVTAKG